MVHKAMEDSIDEVGIFTTCLNTPDVVSCKSFVAFQASSCCSAYVDPRSLSGANLCSYNLAISNSPVIFAIQIAITNGSSSSLCIPGRYIDLDEQIEVVLTSRKDNQVGVHIWLCARVIACNRDTERSMISWSCSHSWSRRWSDCKLIGTLEEVPKLNQTRSWCRGNGLGLVDVCTVARLCAALLGTWRLTVIDKPVRGLVKEIKRPHRQLQDVYSLTS